MCGRYTLRRLPDYIRSGLDPFDRLLPFDEFDEKKIVPRFNIAPSQQVPLIFVHEGKSILDTAAWGFVP